MSQQVAPAPMPPRTAERRTLTVAETSLPSSPLARGRSAERRDLGRAAMRTMLRTSCGSHRVTPCGAPPQLFCLRSRSVLARYPQRIRPKASALRSSGRISPPFSRASLPLKAGSRSGAGRRTEASRVQNVRHVSRAGAASRPALSSVPDNAPHMRRDGAKMDRARENFKEYFPLS